MRRAVIRRGLAVAGVTIAVLGYQWLRDPIGGALGLGGSADLPAKGEHLRVVTWNLHNFPRDRAHRQAMPSRLKALHADVLALQEIRDPEALEAALPDWRVRTSPHGGRRDQHLAIAWNPRTVSLVGGPHEHRAVAIDDNLRPAFSARLAGRNGGPDFHVVVVHLKARPEGLPLRRRQWTELATVVQSLPASDGDVLVVGDFNTTGAAGEDGAGAELQALQAALDPVGLQRLRHQAGERCSAYWDGGRRDAWKRPSLLDHLWVADLAESLDSKARVALGGHCARHACQGFRTSEAYPDRDHALSDHCPLAVDLRPGDDD